MRFRRTAVLLFPVFMISLLYSQVAEAPDAARPSFKAKVQVVLLDVVVSDRDHHPITGLHSDDFEVFENGKQQTIASFEEQRGNPSATVAERPSLPPHFYSNAPLGESLGSINVLLLDSLNTEFADQATVRLQMINYLKTIRPGPLLAIFTLGARLRMVEGFTADPKVLLEAINHKHWGGTPETSTQLRTSAENNLDQTMLTRMSESNGMNPGASAGAIEALKDFLAEVQATQAVTRMSSTLDALADLSRYLSGFHGRKNIIWFSGSFPEIEFPGTGGKKEVNLDSNNGLGKQLKDTIDMLAAAQIAVYPISAQGLETQAFYEASNPTGRARGLQNPNIEGQNQALSSDNVNRYFNQKSAHDIAANTGGEAFDNTNSLKDALAKAVEEGAYYYRLSYSPTDRKMLGRYRQIRVNIKNGPHPAPSNIAYRRGYYEENEKQEKADKADKPELPTDYLHPLMSRGLPDATEIVYNLRLLRSSTPPGSGVTPVGDNKDLHGAVTRISADFVIPLANLDFELTPDGVRHGNLELSLVAYDHAGRPMNWIVRSIRASLTPAAYPSVQKTGVQFHQELDVPSGDHLYLRSGIYDLESNRAGTLEVPLSEVTEEHLSAETRSVPVETSATTGPKVSSPPAPTHALSGSPAPDPKESNASIALGSGRTEAPEALPPSAPALAQPSLPVAKDPVVSDIPAYCAGLAASVEHPAALAKVCEFVLSSEKRLPDVICDREMKRYWTEYRSSWGGSRRGTRTAVYEVKHADLLTAHVSYRQGKEYYEDVRLDGQPVSSEASLLPAASLSGTWSVGEFATILAGAFLPPSNPEFVFERQTKVRSAKALLFRFHIRAQNNRSYFLFVGDKVWFPEYGGELWIDENSFQLLRLKRETIYLQQYPIRQVETSIDYANVPLGDGSQLVLPIHSEVRTCAAPVDGNSNDCSRSIVKFTHWHKFGATTTIVMTPGN